VFRRARPQGDGSCSLEIWLQPGLIGSESTILAFDSSADHSLPFSLRQYGNSIAVQRYVVDQQGIVRRPWLKVDHVFREGKQVFVSITSGKKGTTVYVDGVLVELSSSLGLTTKDMTGRLVIANSTVDDSWPGQIMGLAIYDRELTSSQIGRHFETWTAKQKPALDGEEAPFALYLFDERRGNIAHNSLDLATDLTLPARYSVLHPVFLRSTWSQYYNARNGWRRWSYWKDIAVNIAGFIPFGFVLSAYFYSVWRIARPAIVIILLGFVLSFAIEALQWLLPTRDSSMTDIITNTTGTALGVLLYRYFTVQMLLRHLAIVDKIAQ
jgi:VanZ family protein